MFAAGWTQAIPSMVTAFFASSVEFVEALTVILAVGQVRGWRAAIEGALAALAALAAIVAVLGPVLTRVPIGALQLVVGALTLLFGLRWLRKAILRSIGVIKLHDETAAYAAELVRLRALGRTPGRDLVAFGTAFQITFLEGMEVVFIVIAIGAGGSGLLVPASLGALAALSLVAVVGVAVHRPLSQVPENTLKFIVGVLLSGFGTFWAGEGIGVVWPGEDWSILGLSLGFLLVALLLVQTGRARLAAAEAA